ncbi:uroporphyrinogen-III C-methyltransferase [Uliginosibacterium sp. 31-12]|uniref:uroporphyrinogen-III C-methyltransferase n=1 Tax=Uliginosibacterium sp. 31-12 TaxID=3062781 RepID=UPI0026E3013D|nr:uroporphyrinogen-III C-methyltransferase [Uliginosibacterium sp. 31-12]MDO6386103.1 uroporphyrinogen-III C-methyltransferase [Uliginosibacterium sp. 31-12]
MENQVLPPQPSAPEAKHRSGPRWNRIYTSAAVAALALLGWLAYDTRHDLASVQAELQQRVAEGDKSAQEARTLARQGLEQLETAQGRITTLEARLHESETQYASVEALRAEFARMRDERALDEIALAIEIAVQQLQFAGNVPAALNALKAADTRLALLDQSRYLPLRKLVTRDIETLKTLPGADTASVALQLETIIARVDSLPLGFERQVPPPPKAAKAPTKKAAASSSSAAAEASAPLSSPNALMSLLGDLWQDFRGLIRIERLDRPDPALLAPSQAAYLRENLRLRLLSARVALLQREGKLFAEDMQQASLWLKRYFDLEAPAVAGTAEELARIAQARPGVQLPALEDTQAALRALKSGSKR